MKPDTDSLPPAPAARPVEIPVRAAGLLRALLLACVSIEIGLVLLDYHVNYSGLTDLGSIRRLTNITREDSLASWLGTTQTVFLALTLWVIWLAVRSQAAERWRRIGWLVLACSFSFMALDDGALLHERAGTVFKDLHSSDASGGEATEIGARALDAFPSYPWHIVALPIFVALGLFLLAFLWRELPSPRMRWIVVAALGCFVTALALDFVEGLDRDHPWNLYTRISQAYDFGDWTEYKFGHNAYDTLRHFSKSIEEFLEMFANTLLWYVFLKRLMEMAPELRFRFRGQV